MHDHVSSLIDQIKRAISVEDLASDHVQVKQSGSLLLCCSPFRDEKDPSFYIYPDEQRWWDYGPSEGGDVIDLAQKLYSCELPEALTRLAARAGIAVRRMGEEMTTEERELVDSLIEHRWVKALQTKLANYYNSCLPREVREHLNSHYGITDRSIDRLLIGWSDGTAAQKLRDQGETDDRLLATGAFIRTSHGRVFEHHEKRIVFPYWSGGQVVYMISRRYEGLTPDDDWQKTKYKKSLVFHEDRHPYVSRYVNNSLLWGEDCLRGPVDQVIVTEGVTDAIAAWQANLNVISPVTTKIRDKDIERVVDRAKNAKTTIVINDNEVPKKDPRTGKEIRPAEEGALKTARMLHQAGRNVRIGTLPRPVDVDKVDLNSYLRDHSVAELNTQVIATAQTLPAMALNDIPKDLAPELITERLKEVYDLISTCDPTTQTLYVAQIARKLGLGKKAVAQSIKDRILELKQDRKIDLEPVPPTDPSPGSPPDVGDDGSPPIPPPPSRPSLPPGSPGSGDPQNSSRRNRTTSKQIHGSVFETEEEHYAKLGQDGTEQRLSNFTLHPVYLADVNGKLRICCNIRIQGGRTYHRVLLPENALTSSRELVKTMQSLDPTSAWSGTDANVQGIIIEMFRKEIPTLKGVPTLGYALSPEGEPRWVTANDLIGPQGPLEERDVVYAPVVHQPPLAGKVNVSGAYLPDLEIRNLVRDMWPLLHQLNEPDVIIPLTSWFAAAMLAPEIRKALGHMPILWVYGMHGSGKTAIISDVMWPMFHGVKSVPGSCSDTQFAMLRGMSSSSSIADTIDEYKTDLRDYVLENLCRMLRRAYVGDIEQRGRPDMSVSEYALTSPICIMGEMGPDDPALRERIIPVIPTKQGITEPRKNAMSDLLRLNPVSVSGGLVKMVLQMSFPEILKGAKEDMQELLSQQNLPPRIHDNLLVLCIGDRMCRTILQRVGLHHSTRPPLKLLLPQILDQITEVGQEMMDVDEGEQDPATPQGQPVVRKRRDRTVLDSMDLFMTELATYAHLKIIVEGIHYIFVNGKLFLHLASCHKTYLEERLRTREPVRTNGIKALKQIIKEKSQYYGRSPERYVEDRVGRAQLGGIQARFVVIDPVMMSRYLGIELPTEAQESTGLKLVR